MDFWYICRTIHYSYAVASFSCVCIYFFKSELLHTFALHAKHITRANLISCSWLHKCSVLSARRTVLAHDWSSNAAVTALPIFHPRWPTRTNPFLLFINFQAPKPDRSSHDLCGYSILSSSFSKLQLNIMDWEKTTNVSAETIQREEICKGDRQRHSDPGIWGVPYSNTCS